MSKGKCTCMTQYCLSPVGCLVFVLDSLVDSTAKQPCSLAVGDVLSLYLYIILIVDDEDFEQSIKQFPEQATTKDMYKMV